MWRDHVHAALHQIRLLIFKRVKSAIAHKWFFGAVGNIHNSNRTNRVAVSVIRRLTLVDHKQSFAVVRELDHVWIKTNFNL